MVGISRRLVISWLRILVSQLIAVIGGVLHLCIWLVRWWLLVSCTLMVTTRWPVRWFLPPPPMVFRLVACGNSRSAASLRMTGVFVARRADCGNKGYEYIRKLVGLLGHPTNKYVVSGSDQVQSTHSL